MFGSNGRGRRDSILQMFGLLLKIVYNLPVKRTFEIKQFIIYRQSPPAHQCVYPVYIFSCSQIFLPRAPSLNHGIVSTLFGGRPIPKKGQPHAACNLQNRRADGPPSLVSIVHQGLARYLEEGTWLVFQTDTDAQRRAPAVVPQVVLYEQRYTSQPCCEILLL